VTAPFGQDPTPQEDLADFTDDDSSRFNGIPGFPEVWKDSASGKSYLVFYPESGPQPPVPLLFIIDTEEELESLFGDKDVVYDRELNPWQIQASGAVLFGEMASIDRYNSSGQLIQDPWAGFTSRMERSMSQMPWLAEDAEVFAIVAGAYLEGRPIEDWELEDTDYFQSHSGAEREAMRLQLSDPVGYQDRNDKYATSIYDELASYGLDPQDEVVQWLANEYNSGMWTWEKTQAQIQAYLGRGGAEELDTGFSDWLSSEELKPGEATSHVQDVRDLYKEWLGPAYPPDDASITRWASMFDNDQSGGRAALEDFLRQQRLVLFPAYENENATYRDISAPWRSFTEREWGVPVDETDVEFQKIVQMNDPVEAQKKARTVGSDRGYEAVVASMVSDIEQGMRSGVRGAV
jgi:hypothetical protein